MGRSGSSVRERLMNRTLFTTYVEDISKTGMFYELLFEIAPITKEDGSLVFELNEMCGLSIKPLSLLQEKMVDNLFSKLLKDKPQALEISTLSDTPEKLHAKALRLGALELDKDEQSGIYRSINHDGHILIFEKE